MKSQLANVIITWDDGLITDISLDDKRHLELFQLLSKHGFVQSFINHKNDEGDYICYNISKAKSIKFKVPEGNQSDDPL